ncbi:unnamed protein product [Brassica napus]|uniref:(rape) hypothetical protein n=1 Tax=Brassica napus TaxID=3708 RepID=A0A816YVG0_BRANA|nr:unnamed protein product [Brassica napus]
MCYMNKNHKRKWLQNYKIKRRVVGTHMKPFWFLCSFWNLESCLLYQYEAMDISIDKYL